MIENEVRFCRGLKIDEAKAKKYAEMAIKNPYSVMQNMDDEAKMEKGAGLVFVNNIETFANQYGEARMGSAMYAYMGGYEDPRLPAYFQQSSWSKAQPLGTYGKYAALPPGTISKNNDTYKSFSVPNIAKNSPTYWMRASEVYFLRAEGALRHWDMGDTDENLYYKGILMSFKENGVDEGKINDYIYSDKQPIGFELEMLDPYIDAHYKQPTTATVEYGGNQNRKMEKIMIQKWIALYPNGMEAWSEVRRTGYPKLHRVYKNRSNGLIDSQKGIRRLQYPTQASSSKEDLENLEKARQMLKGPDNGGTPLWWDCLNN